MADRLDDKGRPWTGDFHRQQILRQRINRIIDGKDVVDIMAALGTITANMVADLSESEEVALRGIEAHAGDLREVVRARFAAKKTAH